MFVHLKTFKAHAGLNRFIKLKWYRLQMNEPSSGSLYVKLSHSSWNAPTILQTEKVPFYNNYKQFVTQKFPRIFTDDLLRPLATNYYPETLRRPDLLTHLADPVGRKC